MKVGDRIRWGSEVGVLLSVDGDHATVSVPSGGVITVPIHEVRTHDDNPIDLLTSGRIGDAQQYRLRLRAELLRHAYRFDPLAGLSNARVEPKHHQIYVAHRVTRKPLPRMILADEVGLGKTIEAGLILKELQAREVASRTLVVVPANLRTQWQHELAAKFNMDFVIIDGDAARYLGRDGANPFEASPNIICSLSFARRPERRHQITALPWDLVIFDEAHHVRANESGVTQGYRLADELKHHVGGMLLLTATPMQLSVSELWGLIELVEPGLYPSVAHYDEVRARFPALNALMKQVKSWAALTDGDRERFLEEAGPLLRACDLPGDLLQHVETPEARERTLNAIAEAHHLADVLVRNRRADVGGFTTRTARRIPVETTVEEEAAYEAVTEYLRSTYNLAGGGNNALGFLMVTYHKMLASSSAAIYLSLKRRRTKLEEQLATEVEQPTETWTAESRENRREALELSESILDIEGASTVAVALEAEIEVLSGLIGQLGKLRDSKARTLVSLVDQVLQDDPDEKVLIFTQFIETQRLLTTALGARGFKVEAFNGQMSIAEKDAVIEHFRRSAQVLVSTEAGGEGRNLQFCHIVCNYDLPWNPMRVEQRIGRVDRIGQTRPVTIYNLANVDTIEERVLDVLEKRIRLFEESIGSLDPILGSVEQDIEQLALVARREQEERFEALEVDVERRVREALDAEETLRDFALERNSFRQDETNALLGRRAMAQPQVLRTFVDQTLRFEGGVLSEEVDGRTSITLSPALERRLGRRVSVYRGTFQPDEAVREETWDFFAMGHELIDDLVAAARQGTEGLTGARIARDAPLDGGVEFFYEIAVGGLQHAGRLIRHVIGPSLELVEEVLERLPAIDDREVTGPVPSMAWMPDAVERSQAAARKHLDEVSRAAVAELADVRRAKQDRAVRVFSHRRTQLQYSIAQREATIAQLEGSDDEERRRILPALYARVEKDRQRIAELEIEHEEELKEIEALEPSVSLRTIVAGLVMRE